MHGARVGWPVVHPSHVEAVEVATGLLATVGVFAAAALGLFGRPLRERLPDRVSVPARRAVRRLRGLHSGHVGDYIAWWTAGASLLGTVCLLALS